MKIHHPNGIQPPLAPQSDDAKVKRVDQAEDFTSVLKKAAANPKPASEVQANVQGRPVHSIMTGVELGQPIRPEDRATHLLDALESYQHLLADPLANLKQVQPAVERMKVVAAETETLVEKVPSGNVIMDVIRESLLQINKEIVRFESGEYVDE